MKKHKHKFKQADVIKLNQAILFDPVYAVVLYCECGKVKTKQL